MLRRLRIGTRGSFLARAQTGQVADRLRALGVEVSIEIVTTRGDAGSDRPVPSLGGDGVFVRELEQALLDGRIDAAVHSCKDLPTADTPGLAIGCVPERVMPFDVLVGPAGATIRSLPPGAVVGTSSVRRAALLAAARPDIVSRPIRGNVDSRLKRLDAGEYDALILAGAGLERLGLAPRITAVLEPPDFWPAVAQGALAIQVRDADADTRAALAALDHTASHLAVLAERAFLSALAGGCLAPVGGWARIDGDALSLGGCVLEPNHETVARLEAQDRTDLPPGCDVHAGRGPAESLGRRVAGRLVAGGADAMLARVRERSGGGQQPPVPLNQKT